MLRTILFTLIAAGVIVGLDHPAFAWDGTRKGFILGAGVGGGLISYTQEISGSNISVKSDRENTLAFMYDVRIGYAPSNLWQIYYLSEASWFGLDNIVGDRVTIASGLSGVGVTKYVRAQAPSPFFLGSIGLTTWSTPFEERSGTWVGAGLMLGGGFEFSRHWSVEGNLVWGKPKDEDSGVEVSSNTFSIRVTVNVLGY